MVKVNGKELVFSESFVARDNQLIELSIPLSDATLRMSLEFVAGEAESRGASWKTEDGVTRIRFNGWNNAIGTAFVDPPRLGDLKGQPLWFQVAHHRIGDANLVHFYVLVGGENG